MSYSRVRQNSGNLLRERKKKLRIDARVIMEDDEYENFCDRLDGERVRKLCLANTQSVTVHARICLRP